MYVFSIIYARIKHFFYIFLHDIANLRQFPPFISISLKNIIPYQLNLYIRIDGLKFTRY